MDLQEDEPALKRQRAADDTSYRRSLENSSNAHISVGVAAAFTSLPASLSSSSASSPTSSLPTISAQEAMSSQSSTPLAEVLTTLNLPQFQDGIQSEGNETKADLAELTQVQAEQVCDTIGIKSGQKIRFFRCVQEQCLRSSSSSLA